MIFFGGHLPQISGFCSAKRLFARIFTQVGVENNWRFNGMRTPSMEVRTKVLASFEAGMNLPNLPWHVNITSLKHRSRFGEVPYFRQIIHRIMA